MDGHELGDGPGMGANVKEANLPLVFIPGMMCDGRLFGLQIEYFSAHRTVIVPRIPDARDMAAIVKRLLPQLPEQFALCGLSMGGIIAMEVLRQAPDRVKKQAFLDTNPRAELPEVAQGRQAQIDVVKAGGLSTLMAETFIPKYLNNPKERPDIVKICQDMAASIGALSFEAQSLALRDRPDQSETLRQSRNPTLILCGADDQLCPVERHEYMHELMPHSRLEIIKNAGHLPTLEKPGAVNALLAEWLNHD